MATGQTPPFGWNPPAGYEFDALGTCSSCREPIAWAYTPKGNRAPMNLDGVSHFATCPNAADHRRPKPAAPAEPEAFMVPPSHDDPMSQAAAASVLGATGAIRARVYDTLRERGPLAAHELERILSIPGNTLRPRLGELRTLGLVKQSGRTKTPSGRSAWQWVATPKESA